MSTNRQNGKCFANSASTSAQTEDKLVGKYGTAEILQEGDTAGSLVCGIYYKFNDTGVSDKLKGKEIVLKVTEDSTLQLTKETFATKKTEIAEKYLPSAFK
ncbi:pilin [Moraxella lincolnii]|uniref:pilin n=1 Tax=Lwoffella lincolnii TaxID=90241 RepID=UPI0030D55002